MASYQCRKSHCGDKTVENRLVSIMGFPILVRWHLYIDSVPGSTLLIAWHTSNYLNQCWLINETALHLAESNLPKNDLDSTKCLNILQPPPGSNVFLNCASYSGHSTSHINTYLPKPLQWRHYERGGVSNHQRLDCLLNRLFRRR